MNDDTKRKIIRFLNSFDRVSSKATPNKGWNAKTVTRDEPAWRREASDELDHMSGQELDRELRRQLAYTVPVALFLGLVLYIVLRIIVTA